VGLGTSWWLVPKRRSRLRRRLEYTRYVDHNHVAMRNEPRLGSKLAGADLKLQFHRRAIGWDTALPNVGRALGEGSDESERSRPCLPNAAGCALPLAIEDVRVHLVCVGVDQGEPLVPLTPGFNMREEMELWLLGHPGGLPECCDKLAGTGNELLGITDAEPTVVTVPPDPHRRTLHRRVAWTAAQRIQVLLVSVAFDS
jgi:hypothetical protein